MIALVIPSRGLIKLETLESVENELRNWENIRLFSHDLPIPDSFNVLTRQALAQSCEYVWFVEEDVIPPPGALLAMLELDSDIAFVDYPMLKRKWDHCHGLWQGKVVWVGMGCTLVKHKVFEALPIPWFKSNHKLVSVHAGSTATWKLKLIEAEREYGGQDLYFCVNAFMQGFSIKLVPGMTCTHQ